MKQFINNKNYKNSWDLGAVEKKWDIKENKQLTQKVWVKWSEAKANMARIVLYDLKRRRAGEATSYLIAW